MTNTAVPAIETSNENGHLIYTITVNGVPVANRYMHIVSGRHYVRDFTTDPIGVRVVDGTLDEKVAKVAFMKIYKRHAA